MSVVFPIIIIYISKDYKIFFSFCVQIFTRILFLALCSRYSMVQNREVRLKEV